MGSYVLRIEEVDRSQVALVGGKGANLGELRRIDGVVVPPGFCITTDAFRRVVADASIAELLVRLSDAAGDHAPLAAEIRRAIEAALVPEDVASAITDAVAGLGEGTALAVRSSATAEDLPDASFAGQHDSYLGVVGPAGALEHVRRCWASLFTDRAVAYRLRNGIAHHTVHTAVVVQELVDADASGVLFTADPTTSNRTVAVVEAIPGLGEELVSGLVDPESYTVRDGKVVDAPHGARILTDAQAVQLVDLGRQIEAHLGPQDIEWCFVRDDLRIVQSRPITTLFPIPGPDDGTNHVYLSVGHQQMMTDAMRPLGVSVWQLTALPPMHEAAGRLFVDATQALASPTSRAALMETFDKADPGFAEALRGVVDREGFLPPPPADGPPPSRRADPPGPLATDPAVVTELIEAREASLAELQREIRTKSGAELFDFILEDIATLKQIVFEPRSHQVVMGGMEAAWWLNEHLEDWLGERNAADVLTRSVPHNVTSEMGLALLDVADAIRPQPEVVAVLRGTDDDAFLERLDGIEGGAEARDAIQGFLDRYGMRCVGEIDITRPRWGEQPSALLPLILTNVESFERGEAARRFERGRRQAEAKEQDVLWRLRELPDGENKAAETKAMIDRVRTFAGFREYPKYVIVCRHFEYKRALVLEARHLVDAGVLDEVEDAFFLTFQELHEAVRTRRPLDPDLIPDRRRAFRSYETLTAPRVITSDGEVVAGHHLGNDVPADALVGLAVSSGVVEGRARVVVDLGDADLEPGDILVTRFTDPSWTPAFVTAAALVTEVGGVMSHGAVIAREYGLPAVVNVEHATGSIRDGQRIRVDATKGWVELVT